MTNGNKAYQSVSLWHSKLNDQRFENAQNLGQLRGLECIMPIGDGIVLVVQDHKVPIAPNDVTAVDWVLMTIELLPNQPGGQGLPGRVTIWVALALVLGKGKIRNLRRVIVHELQQAGTSDWAAFGVSLMPVTPVGSLFARVAFALLPVL